MGILWPLFALTFVTRMTGSTLSSLALDSSRGLLYFTDPGNGTLGVLSTDVINDSPNLLIAGANEKTDSHRRRFHKQVFYDHYYLIHI